MKQAKKTSYNVLLPTDYEELSHSNICTLDVQTLDKNRVCGHTVIKNSSTLPGNIPFALRIGLHLTPFSRVPNFSSRYEFAVINTT